MKEKKILVVDDEPDMRTFLSTLLETSGFTAVAAENGIEGVQKAREVKPDLIILNVMMPKENGVQMYRQLKISDQLKQIPVIMISAISKKSFLRCQKILTYWGSSFPEPEAYIKKPLESDELIQLVESLLSAET
nr:response regulator [Desulfobacterales bacterium]